MPDVPDRRDDYTEIIAGLLALPDLERRADLLCHHGLLHADGLDALLDEADAFLDSDPGMARELAECCTELAGPADAPVAVPRADYILAQASFVNGEFGRAMELIGRARDRYLERGMDIEALRTDVGKTAALLELGRYGEALDLSQRTLTGLHEQESLDAKTFHDIAAPLHLNRGGCYEYMGLYDEAFAAYDMAERSYREADLAERVSQVDDNRGILLLSLGRGDEALEIFERSAGLFEASGMHMAHTRSLINIGYTHLQLGNYMSSLEYFEKAQRILESADALADEHGLLLDTATAYAVMNMHSEALSVYDRVLELLKETGAAHEQALALWGIGAVLVSLGEFDRADETFREAIVLFEEAGNVPLRASVMLERSMLLSSRGEERLALELAEEALDLVSRSGEWPLQRLNIHLGISKLLAADPDRAESHVAEATRLLTDMSLPQLRYRCEESMGRVRLLQGRRDEALDLYKSAVKEVERLRGTVTRDSMRASFLDDKTSLYEGLLKLVLERSPEIEALDVAEQAKSRALAELMEGLTSPTHALSEDGDLERRLKVLQSNLSAVYNALLIRGMEPDEDGPPSATLQARAMELEAEISRLRLRIDASRSQYSDPFEMPSFQGYLPDELPSDVIMLAYHVLDDEILVFLVFGGEVRVMRNVGSLARVRELLRKLESQWDRFRSGQSFSERQTTMLEKSTNRVLAALYDEVMRPVEPILAEAIERSGPVPRLAIVPHGPLHQAPFHAFFDGEGYLLEKFEISYAPSAAVFALCQQKRTRPTDRIAAAGVSDDLISIAGDEVRSIGALFPQSEILTDEQVTLEALEGVVERCGILHMACHGMFRSDGPMFSALKLHDGWLLAYDVVGLKLDEALVTLSACESGRSAVVGGDEILGLARAFLGAGAATLLVSLWIVQDDTTPDLMRRFYEHLLSGDTPATALRSAQLWMRETHPHPYYWAPFVIVGKR